MEMSYTVTIGLSVPCPNPICKRLI